MLFFFVYSWVFEVSKLLQIYEVDENRQMMV